MVSPADVLALTTPTPDFLCGLSANVHRIEFLKYTIRDMDSQAILFEVERDRAGGSTAPPTAPIGKDAEAAVRQIRYQFPPSMLRRATIGAKLIFSTGSTPLKNFRMIERHYFRSQLLKSFDFTFGFCIPHSTNSWEAIYELPNLSPELEKEIIEHPFETRSDSFYFVEDTLVMHNKAEYAYNAPERKSA